MSLEWKSVYAEMHRDGAADFPPACLHYLLELVRQGAREGAMTAPDTVEAFRTRIGRDFGPLAADVLREWELRDSADLGKAVLLLGRYRCLSLDPADTAEAFAAIGADAFFPEARA